MCDLEFVTDPPTPYQHPQWNQATHEWAMQEAGFREFAWHPSEVAPEDLAHYGTAYWHDFYDNCLVIGRGEQGSPGWRNTMLLSGEP
jgi:toxoflavin synthase